MLVPRLLTYFVLGSLMFAAHSTPICHDTIPFSTKLAQSPLIIYGDIVETSSVVPVRDHTGPFNITFLTRCTFKGVPPAEQTIVIKHILPDDPLCYRKFVQGYTYVFFLNQTAVDNHYEQMPYHELSMNEGATVEILKRTCGIQTRPFRAIVTENSNEVDQQCPIVSVNCL